MAVSGHADTPRIGRPVTAGSATPYTTPVDVNPAAAPNAVARLKDPAKRQECTLAMLRNRVDFDWRV